MVEILNQHSKPSDKSLPSQFNKKTKANNQDKTDLKSSQYQDDKSTRNFT